MLLSCLTYLVHDMTLFLIRFTWMEQVYQVKTIIMQKLKLTDSLVLLLCVAKLAPAKRYRQGSYLDDQYWVWF
jgi:hypothetical protein